MRRFLIASVMGSALILGALPGGVAFAADPECRETTVDENIEIVTAYVGHHDAADMDGIDMTLSDDHSGLAQMGAAEQMGTNADEHTIAMAVEAAYPGSSYRIDEIYGFDDKVVVLASHIVPAHMLTGEMVEMEAPVEAEGLALYTLACGQIVESHSTLDIYGLLVGLGLLPAPLPPTEMAAD